MAKKSSKNRGLYPQYHYSYNREFVDFDYVGELTEEEAEWLANFSDNYYGARFKKDISKNPINDLADRRTLQNSASRRRFDFMSGRPKGRTVIKNSELESMEITDLGVAIETRTGKKSSSEGSDE